MSVLFVSVLVALAPGLTADAAVAQDPELRHELDELTLRRGDKPWIRLFEGGVFPSERTIFRDTITGAEMWRLTDDSRRDMHQYYDIPVWNSTGKYLIVHHLTDLFRTAQWVIPADGSWTRPVEETSLELMESGDWPTNPTLGDSFWSWQDPNLLINSAGGVISLVDPLTGGQTEVFDLTQADQVTGPRLPELEAWDFKLVPPHPLDDRLLFGTHPKGRIFSFDMATSELIEMPTDGRWEVPASSPDAITIHRLRWTKSLGEPTLLIAQDSYNDNGTLVIESRQYTATLDGLLTGQMISFSPDQRAGHPDMTMDGSVITGTYGGGTIWQQSFDGATPERIIFDAPVQQHHASCTWDDRWLASDNPNTGGDGMFLRGFDIEFSNVLVSSDGRSQNVLNYHYSSYTEGAESTHPGPTSSPDGTKLAYDSDMLDRATASGGDGDGNPDLWMVVVRPPAQPRNITTSGMEVSWERPLHAREELYWNPGNLARETAGYNVFRGLASGGPYEQLNDQLIDATAYQDTTYEAGVSYYYVVQAVEHSGLASLYSEEVFGSTEARRWQGDVRLYYEAEDAELTLPMVAQFEALGTSGSWFVGTFAQEPDPSFPLEVGPAAMTFSVDLPLPGRYSLWARVRGFDFGGSIDVEVDGVLQNSSFDVPNGDWTWVELPGSVRARSGGSTIALLTEDAEIGIDQVALMLGADGPPPEFGNRDSLAPAAPSDPRLVAINGNTKKLEWSPSPDKDVAYYNVYCGRDSQYALGNRNLLRSPRKPVVFDWGIPAGLETVYKITAVDHYGNESEAIVFDPGVEGEESAPEAVDDSYQISEDEVLEVPALGVLANDIDDDGDVLTATVVSGVENGVLELLGDGGFTYTPSLEFSGVDSFKYTATDGISTSEVATVTITIGILNDAPVANDDAYETDEDVRMASGIGGGVLANDSDVEWDLMTAVLVSDVQHGVLELLETGVVQYWPADDFNGTDSFTYYASDGVSNSNVATVTLTVHSVEDLPVAEKDEYVISEDTVLDIPAPGLLANDVDADGDTLQALLDVGPTDGTVIVRLDGSFVYTPNPDYHGHESFTYVVTDGKGSSEPAIVLITVNVVNDGPQAGNDAYATQENVTLQVDADAGVLVNDSDPDGDNLDAILVTGTQNGTLVLQTNGKLSYQPNRDFHGIDTFTYLATDGSSNSNIATVTITVANVNDAPIAARDYLDVDEDNVLDLAAPGVLANDSDIDGDVLTAVLLSSPVNGTIDLQPDGRLIYVPNPNFEGVEIFDYLATDGQLDSNVSKFRITVHKVNDLPVAVADSYVIPGDANFDLAKPGLLSNDTDADDAFLTAVLVTDVTTGTLLLKTDGSIRYTPERDFSGIVSFSYQVSDGEDLSAPVPVTITVQ